jgi:YVTN family beta-propeller protein
VFIDTGSRRVVGSVSVGRPHNIAMHPNGQTAYVGSQTPGKFALAVVDLPRRAVTASVPLDRTPRGLEFTPDGKRLYLTQAGVDAVVVLDAATNGIISQIPMGVSPHYAAFTANGRYGLTVVQGPACLPFSILRPTLWKRRSRSEKGPTG